ncbi:MAG: crossover junction endodeoxyribonuclease RuvC [Myxococcota bacterium]|nr:crossover junction endodeoxyribonuclease RuvC [Myxococcota bacterium]
MIVIGIDPGTRFTGYGVVEKNGNKLTRLDSGRINAGTSKDPLPERLERIYDGLHNVLAQHKPDHGSLEGIFHARNAMSSLKLGHARGVSMLALKLHEVELHEYPPASIKQALTGNGRATKESVEQMVKLLLGIRETLLEDESDALAAAICHCNSIDFHRRLG